MSILIRDDSTIADLRAVVDALGSEYSIEWSDDGIELTRTAEVDSCPECFQPRLDDGLLIHRDGCSRKPTFTVQEVTVTPTTAGSSSPEWVHVQSATEPARPVDQAARAAHPHVCTECGTGFDKAQGLRVHVARKHGPNADVPDRPRVDQDAARARAAEAL